MKKLQLILITLTLVGVVVHGQYRRTDSVRVAIAVEMTAGEYNTCLDSLITKGLASYIIKEKTKYYSAAEPNKILEHLEEKKETFS